MLEHVVPFCPAHMLYYCICCVKSANIWWWWWLTHKQYKDSKTIKQGTEGMLSYIEEARRYPVWRWFGWGRDSAAVAEHSWRTAWCRCQSPQCSPRSESRGSASLSTTSQSRTSTSLHRVQIKQPLCLSYGFGNCDLKWTLLAFPVDLNENELLLLLL